MTQTLNIHSFIRHLAWRLILLALGIGCAFPFHGDAAPLAVTSPDGVLSARVDPASGDYEITNKTTGWAFSGSLAQPLKRVKTVSAEDVNGEYQAVSMAWTEGPLPMKGEIRVYQRSPLVLFSATCEAATELPPQPFPAFTHMAENLHVFSYQEKTFAPPQFAASDCSTPWLLFDDSANAMVISPASHFMVAAMSGDGHHEIASGFKAQLRNLPPGFSQQTIMVFGQGINRTWDAWGQSLLASEHARRPGNDADTVLKYFGYWTDNGAYYYYNYDLAKGYAGTLQSLVDHYRQQQIPIRYLQLDSWWYYKSFTGPDGKVGKIKASKLPAGEWNRYGGLLEYKAHPALFPHGLAAFQESVQLPLVTHNRWIDLASPYRQHYRISGVAAVDPKWWDDIAAYLKASGITTYEQDWLDRIYKYSPAFSSTVGTADAFLDNMSRACREKGITLQYCMPYPCYFLQGSRYPNLTSIRTSDDRFGPGRYNNFLYVSRLADSLGIWPWTDVFDSTEVNNLLLATLSAGPVGIGDAIGAESKENILKSARPDGVIVKPDAPAVPMDQSYLADARQAPAPLLASTDTDRDGCKTEYVAAINRSKSETEAVSFRPAELGLSGPVIVYDYFSGLGRRLDAGETFTANVAGGGVAYYIVAPFGKSGFAFLGDKGKFVGTGRQRIAALRDEPGRLTMELVFAPQEKSVVLHGYSAGNFKAIARHGRVEFRSHDTDTGRFEIEVSPDPNLPPHDVAGDLVRQLTVTLMAANPPAAQLNPTGHGTN